MNDAEEEKQKKKVASGSPGSELRDGFQPFDIRSTGGKSDGLFLLAGFPGIRLHPSIPSPEIAEIHSSGGRTLAPHPSPSPGCLNLGATHFNKRYSWACFSRCKVASLGFRAFGG